MQFAQKILNIGVKIFGMKTQIFIPMTGNGSRFKAKGYEELKPFIKVHNKAIIEWVVKLFPGDESNINFICRSEHIEDLTYFKKGLKIASKNAKIIPVSDWKKKGPVFDVLSIQDYIEEDFRIFISYCDYYMHWDYKKFKKEVIARDCEGAIPCYTGFHPHLIPDKNVYGTCLVDNKENLIEIKEKHVWNEDKTMDYISPGMFYFKNGTLLKKYCTKMINDGEKINGENYMSLVYNFLVNDGLKVWCPANVSKFCQWGTPEDLEEYLYWAAIIK